MTSDLDSIHEKLHQKNRELATLLEISQALTSTIDLDDILQLTIEQSTRVLGLETGAIYLLEDDHLYLGATTPPLPPNFPEKFRSALLDHHPHISQAIASGSPLFLPDTETAILTPQEKEVSIARGLRSLLYVPLPVGERMVGILIMGTTGRSYKFTPDEVNLCCLFAAEMALAVENARMHHQIKLHASELDRLVRERTSQLEALTYSISHDLRAPLRSIRGFSQALLEDHASSLDQEGLRLLQRILDAGQKLEDMFQGLLSLSQVGRRQVLLTTLDLSKLAEQLLTELTAHSPERIFEIQVQPFEYPSGVLRADKIYMEILLTNLISNAIKFTQGKSPARIEFGYTMDGEVCIYYLKDNGVGFDMKDVDSVFSPFKRLHSEKEFGGYGIGLAVVQAIIRLHNGRFWVESEPGVGATFFFTLEDWQG